jgi:hypothetical protein
MNTNRTNPEERLHTNNILRRYLQSQEEAAVHDLLEEQHHLDDAKEPVFHMTIAPEGQGKINIKP